MVIGPQVSIMRYKQLVRPWIPKVVNVETKVQKMQVGLDTQMLGATDLIKFLSDSNQNFPNQFFHATMRSLNKQISANNSTPPRYSKNIRYSAITRGRIVGRYLTRDQVEYLYFRLIFKMSSISG